MSDHRYLSQTKAVTQVPRTQNGIEIYLLDLWNTSIFEQLQLEEMLLRTDRRNFLIVNRGSSPTIVMGISGKIEELVHVDKARAAHVPVIQRFSGGGTVLVDEGTLFVSFIGNREFLHPVPCYPEPILRWAEQIFAPIFVDTNFALRDNDFVLGEKKCGGNAQYLQKDRWLLHTSFLWNYEDHRMELLQHPRKTPSYRAERKHTDFMCRLCEIFPCRDQWIQTLIGELAKHYSVSPLEVASLLPLLAQPHRQATKRVLLD